ncbi:nucleic acid dioxygenase ALKBH1-like [Liolophura sinensis]|uniref:nucleic acid dioxygenase ALKBH1-like n=1 Tax=Liolophura sinensis TaxID=3198878 RepID=UPI003158518C
MATYTENDRGHGENNTTDHFRDQFKRYKRRRPPPDLSDVIDFDRANDFESQVEDFKLTEPTGFEKVPEGLIDVRLWKAYQLRSNPGFLFISNPFMQGSQRYWVRRCLRDYPVKPNYTNLDIHLTLTEEDNIWKDDSLESSNPFPKGSLLSHLRWATLGYHYEWNNRVYFEDKVSEFPSDLSHLTRYVAAALGYPCFCPQSGIVNFYNMESTLCGHTDHSEYDKRAPLISYSFGQSAIFLIGGVTKEVCPVALYLRSGDICVMMEEARLAYHAVPRILSAEAHRFTQAFHLPDTRSESAGATKHGALKGKTESRFPSDPVVDSNCDKEGLNNSEVHSNSDKNSEKHDFSSSVKRDDWERYEHYMKSSRINVNVRQVLQHGQTFPKQEVETEPISR